MLLIWFFTHGQRTVTGSFTEDSKNTTLTCTGTNLTYPFFVDEDPVRSTTKINVIFNSTGIHSISLNRSMFYNSEAEASSRTGLHNAAMNTSFGENGFNADAFSAAYETTGSESRITLYAIESQFSRVSAKYFMIEDFDIKSSADRYKAYYQKEGFSCDLSE